PDKTYDIAILGIGHDSCIACEDERAFKSSWTNGSIDEGIEFASSKGYEYFFLDGICSVDFRIQQDNVSKNQSLILLNEKLSQTTYAPVHQSAGGIVWKLS